MTETTSDPALEVDPSDDAGALAQSRFQFQVELATARCARMLVDDDIVSVVCEWHEDYVVQYRTALSELVSVKHLESSQPRWTVSSLCSDGGLKHLFERWQRVEGRCTSRLQTNAGLRTGASEPAGLRDTCAEGSEEAIRNWAEVLAPKFGADESEVEQFLRGLKIECELPDRHTIAPVQIDSVMRPALRQLGIDDRDAVRLYALLRDVVAEASRTGDPHDVGAALSNPDQLAANAGRQRVLRSKTIDKARALEALGADRSRPRFLLVATSPGDGDRTRLVKKLERGGLGGTGIQSAVRLRSNWIRLEHTWSSELPGGEGELENLRAHVLYLTSQAERDTRQPGQRYAPAMQTRVEQLVTTSALGFDPALPVSDHLLQGLVYDRTEACEVWWSDVFDADAMT